MVDEIGHSIGMSSRVRLSLMIVGVHIYSQTWYNNGRAVSGAIGVGGGWWPLCHTRIAPTARGVIAHVVGLCTLIRGKYFGGRGENHREASQVLDDCKMSHQTRTETTLLHELAYEWHSLPTVWSTDSKCCMHSHQRYQKHLAQEVGQMLMDYIFLCDIFLPSLIFSTAKVFPAYS